MRAWGDLAPLTAEEVLHLTQKEIDDGIRLACKAVATGDAFVYVPQDAIFGGNIIMHCESRERGVRIMFPARLNLGLLLILARQRLPRGFISCRRGELLGETERKNPQASYGADIISPNNVRVI